MVEGKGVWWTKQRGENSQKGLRFFSWSLKLCAACVQGCGLFCFKSYVYDVCCMKVPVCTWIGGIPKKLLNLSNTMHICITCFLCSPAPHLAERNQKWKVYAWVYNKWNNESKNTVECLQCASQSKHYCLSNFLYPLINALIKSIVHILQREREIQRV